MVINIKNVDLTKVSKADAFIVDANVLIFIHRPQPDANIRRKASEYPRFIANLRNKGCQIIVSSLNLQEVLYVIETTCWKRYQDSDP